MDATGLELIGCGMTADVYQYPEGGVLKLFKEEYGREAVHYEAGLLAAVCKSGLKVPEYRNILELSGRLGIVSSFVAGPLLFSKLMENPSRAQPHIRALARTHWAINSADDPGLPGQVERFAAQIKGEPLLKDWQEELTALLVRLDGESTLKKICHGDFHVGNVIASPDGHCTIDWMNSYAGNPAGDVLRSYLMMISPYDPVGFRGLQKWVFMSVKRRWGRIYLREYLKVSKLRRRDLKPWLPLVAAVRLCDHVPGEEAWLLDMIQKVRS